VFDRGLLKPWFFRFRLQQELERSHRHGYPMSAVILAPQLLASDRMSAEKAATAAASVVASSRVTELMSWLDAHRIVLVLLDTDADHARIAAERLRSDMWLRSRQAGAIKWLVGTPIDAGGFETVEALLEAVKAA
jgi:hypothetical protein